MADPVGALRERLVIQKNTPAALAVTSLTRVSTLATVTLPAPHGYATNDYVTVAGATPSGYNAKVKITVVSPLVFTFTVSGVLATPATGTITVTYASDAQGGRRLGWTTLDTLPAEMLPLKADERLQLQAVQSDVIYRFRVRRRIGIDPTMRALWTPTWPPGSARETLEITGVLPDDWQWMFLELAKSPAD